MYKKKNDIGWNIEILFYEAVDSLIKGHYGKRFLYVLRTWSNIYIKQMKITIGTGQKCQSKDLDFHEFNICQLQVNANYSLKITLA